MLYLVFSITLLRHNLVDIQKDINFADNSVKMYGHLMSFPAILFYIGSAIYAELLYVNKYKEELLFNRDFEFCF